MKTKGIFVFQRDIRIEDNRALNALLKVCDEVYPIFIFTPEQVTNRNTFKSENSVQFMIESLYDLNTQMETTCDKYRPNLTCLYGKNSDILKSLVNDSRLNITHIGYNMDFTPYAKQRHSDLQKELPNCIFVNEEDYTLHSFDSGELLNRNTQQPYLKFTPFYNNILQLQLKPHKIAKPSQKLREKIRTLPHERDNQVAIDIETITLSDAYARFVPNPNERLILYGGRCHGLKLLGLSKTYQNDYENTRNSLIQKTTQMSAYLKFGCVSIREAYFFWKKLFGISCGLIRQLYWREFYALILYHYPNNLKQSMNIKYDKIKWRNNSDAKHHLECWKKGKTGFPIVDAAMIQMNTTGYMHNRARLIVASFLVKTLLVDWREGEKYFAQKLVDYDVASNNGNWQWVAGSGVDSQPYFRIFNPWSQSETHDKNCIYIKTFLPQLENIPAKDIHEWHTTYKIHLASDSTENQKRRLTYPAPIVDYKMMKEKVIQAYKKALSDENTEK